MPSYHLYVFLSPPFFFFFFLSVLSLHIHKFRNQPCHPFWGRVAVHLLTKKIPSNLNISVAGGDCLPSQEAESKPRLLTHHCAAHCQAALCLYPLHSCKRDKEKHEMARKGWLNLKIISQGSKKKPPWLSISKFVKSPLIIKVKMVWIKTRLLCGLGFLPSPGLDSVPSWSLHFLFTPDLIFCAIPFGKRMHFLQSLWTVESSSEF